VWSSSELWSNEEDDRVGERGGMGVIDVRLGGEGRESWILLADTLGRSRVQSRDVLLQQ
jgi:hypothetical protein